ncbi:MAG: hypothetical protein KAJ86_00515 [Alphaproteobacteria bacterium]|nr:hypothetical protein [Alphaproteobacteria bacterium]
MNDYDNRKTIDDETGAYLVYEGGINYPGMERFSFHWNGVKMEFEAQRKLNEPGDNSWNPNIHWKFFQIDIPHNMQDQRDEIANMIKQALEAHGYIYKRDRYEEVTAEFVPPQNKK